MNILDDIECNPLSPELIKKGLQTGHTRAELTQYLKGILQRKASRWGSYANENGTLIEYAQEYRNALQVIETGDIDSYLKYLRYIDPMLPKNFITRYEQVQEPVEATYKAVRGCEFPNIEISVNNIYSFGAHYVLERPRRVIRGLRNLIGIRSSDAHVDGLGYIERLYTNGVMEFYNYNNGRVFVLNNPAFEVIPDIFHGIGHFEYNLKKKDGYHAGMDEIAAFLFQDELTFALSRLFPAYSRIFDLNNQCLLGHEIISPSELICPSKLHQKYADHALQFRSKTSLHDLNGKMDLLLRCSSPQELEKELAEIS